MRIAAAAATALLAIGCGAAEGPGSDVAHAPVALADQEDAVCGMLVREQSAPRGQVAHRDGSTFFFCSIGDLPVYLGAPSPHGRPEAVFVEGMRPDQDPARPHTGAHPWMPAADAVYVVGVDRPGVMGEPVLAYATRADAKAVVADHPGARILDLEGLRAWWNEREAAR